MSKSRSPEAPSQGRLTNARSSGAAGKRKRLRELLASKDVLVAPGAYDAASAAAIAHSGFPVVHATGAGISCSLGYPDLGLLGMREVADHIQRMVDVTSVPLIADVDTGYGNQLNTIRAIREFERIGVAGLHIEDQVFPKKCGLLSGREVVPLEDMVAKLRAALDTRIDENMVIIARTDARDALGLEAVIERGQAFHQAGADMIFVYGAHSPEELRKIADEVPGPLMTHVSRGASFSDISHADLGGLGYKLVIHALSPLEVAMQAVSAYLSALREAGSEESYQEKMMTYQDLYGLVKLPEWLEAERLYASKEMPR
jgi:2-methylisocitrate lyase-like PEP mutase family enzyme